jgi:DNA replication ATP-dependent helicase Dna2
VSATLWDRLERLLHREHHAILLGHRDLMTLPVEERVDRGDSMAGLAFSAEHDGRIHLKCADNMAKFRPGDGLRLSSADGSGVAVVYESFDDATGTLVVSRDPYRPGGEFDRRLSLQLDPEVQSLTSLALDALACVRSGRSPAAVAVRGILEGTLSRDVDPTRAARAESLLNAVPSRLDPSQREAFVNAIAGKPVTLIQGPPGTGKTHVLARVASALAANGERVLVTAYTHRAVNHALRKILEASPELEVIKAGKPAGADDLRGTGVATVPSLRRVPAGASRPRVIGATLFGLKHAWESGTFDTVVMDEAAQVPLAYASCGLLCGCRAILVGDHRQLGPIVQGRHGDALATRSVFAHLADAFAPRVLRTTYRMNAALTAFPSRTFYGGVLQPAVSSASASFSRVAGGPFDDVFDPSTSAVIAWVAHEGFRTRCAPEADLVARLVLDRLVRQGGDAREIAVVSPYRAQLRLIRTLVRRGLERTGKASRLPVIDTVERMQGQERDLVIVSLSASDPEYLGGDAATFFYAAARLNVTITRARTKLVIVASPRAFEAFPRTLEGMVDADRFRRLRRELPSLDLTSRAPSAA